jgi:transposase InsO family protein
MLTAVQQLFKQAAPRKPIRLQTDKGKEFYNTPVRKFLRGQGVELFSTNSDHKAAIVEGFNRTLKARIYKHFTALNARRCVDLLEGMVHSYNHSRHRTIGRKPADAVTPKDVDAVWRRVYYDSKEAKLRRADTYPTNANNITRVGGLARLSR